MIYFVFWIFVIGPIRNNERVLEREQAGRCSRKIVNRGETLTASSPPPVCRWTFEPCPKSWITGDRINWIRSIGPLSHRDSSFTRILIVFLLVYFSCISLILILLEIDPLNPLNPVLNFHETTRCTVVIIFVSFVHKRPNLNNRKEE